MVSPLRNKKRDYEITYDEILQRYIPEFKLSKKYGFLYLHDDIVDAVGFYIRYKYSETKLKKGEPIVYKLYQKYLKDNKREIGLREAHEGWEVHQQIYEDWILNYTFGDVILNDNR